MIDLLILILFLVVYPFRLPMFKFNQDWPTPQRTREPTWLPSLAIQYLARSLILNSYNKKYLFIIALDAKSDKDSENMLRSVLAQLVRSQSQLAHPPSDQISRALAYS